MNEKLKEVIIDFVDNRSGGAKGLELLAYLVEKGFIQEVEEYEKILKEIPKEIPKFGVLEYYAWLGGDVMRVKHFIYRKLANTNELFIRP